MSDHCRAIANPCSSDLSSRSLRNTELYTTGISHQNNVRAAFIPAIRLLLGFFCCIWAFQRGSAPHPQICFTAWKHIKAADKKGRIKHYIESAARVITGAEFPDRAAVHSGSMKSDCLVSLRSENLPLWVFFFCLS